MNVNLNTTPITQVDRGAGAGGTQRVTPTPPTPTQATASAAAGTPANPTTTPPPPPPGPPPAPGATTNNGPQFGLNPGIEIRPPNHNPGATASGVDALIQKVRDAAANAPGGTVVDGQTQRKSGSIIAADFNHRAANPTGTGGVTGVQDHVTTTVAGAGNAGTENPFIAVKKQGYPNGPARG